MEKISMRKILMTIAVCVMTCTVNAVNHGHSQNPDMRNFSKTFLVKENKFRFTVNANFEYPAGCPELEKIMAEKLFGNDAANLETAFKEYLKRFQDTKEPDYDGEKRDYQDGQFSYATKVLDKEMESLAKQINIPDSVLQQAERYIPVFCSVSMKVSTQMMKADFIPNTVTYMFTYDREERRVLNVTDVFTPTAMEKLSIPNNEENTDVMVRPYTNTVAFSAVVNGKKANREVTITKNIPSFTDRIGTMAISSHIEKLLQENKKRNEEKQEQIRRKREEKKMAETKTTYQYQNTDMKDLYLYLLYDTCYVSGIHKNIMTLTDEEIDRLAETPKCGYIKQEIIEAKRYMTESPEPGFIIIDKDPENSYRMNGDAYPSTQCTPPVAEKTMLQLAKKGKTYHGREIFSKWKAIYIVDSTGVVTMPIVIVDMEDKFNSSIPEMDRLYIAKLRKMKHSKPAIKDGRPVRSINSSGLTRTVTYKWRSNYPGWYQTRRRY